MLRMKNKATCLFINIDMLGLVKLNILKFKHYFSVIVSEPKGSKKRYSGSHGCLDMETYLLAGLDGWECDALGVDHWQDLVPNNCGYDLALGICQELGGDRLYLKALCAARCLARWPWIWHQRNGPNNLQEKGPEVRFQALFRICTCTWSSLFLVSVGGSLRAG